VSLPIVKPVLSGTLIKEHGDKKYG